MNQVDNYYTDQRVLAGESTDWFITLDEDKMQALINDPETDNEVQVGFTYEVCGLCNGKGTHVNPSIDCNGISGNDFAEDPDFYEDYRSCAYDVKCNHCHGKRVYPYCTDERVIRAQEEEAEYQAICAAEMRMGA